MKRSNHLYPNSGAVAELEACLLCGIILCKHDLKRRRPVHKLRQLMEEKIKKTAFVWQHIQNVFHSCKNGQTIALCMPCVHWATRAGKRKKRSYIPLDNFIMYSLHPGRIIASDERIVRRLALSIFSSAIAVVYRLNHNESNCPSGSLSAKQQYVQRAVHVYNPYISILQPNILYELKRYLQQQSLTSAEHNTNRRWGRRIRPINHNIVRAWWKDNAYTLFVDNACTATEVRRNCPDIIDELYNDLMQ